MDRFQRVLERPQGGRPRNRVVVVRDIGRDVALFHRVDNRLGVRVVVGDVVGAGDGAVGEQRDRRRRGAADRDGAQKRLVELGPRGAVKVLDRVVLKDFLDDVLDRELRQVVELARVRDAVAGLSDRQGALRDRKVRLWHRVRLDQHRTCGCYVREHVPGEGIALLLALLADVMHVSELTELDERLYVGAKDVRELAAVKKAAEAVYSPDLTCHEV